MKLYKYTYNSDTRDDRWEELVVDENYKRESDDTVKYFETKIELFEYMLATEKRVLSIKINNVWSFTRELNAVTEDLVVCQHTIEQYEKELKKMKDEL